MSNINSINLVSVGDIYVQKEAHGIVTEVWVFGVSDCPENADRPRYYDCLVTVQMGSDVIASRVCSVAEYKLARCERAGFQTVEELQIAS